jgi:hypothetical protein
MFMAHTVCADCSLCGLRAIDVVLLSYPSPFYLYPQLKVNLIMFFDAGQSMKIRAKSFLQGNLQYGKIVKSRIDNIICYETILLLLFILGEIEMSSPIPPIVKSVVVFISIEKEGGKPALNGTAFFVGVKNPSDPGLFASYLVTAKHVLYKPDTTAFSNEVFIRLNKKSSGTTITKIPIRPEGNNRTVFTHSDSSVDIAVIPYSPNQKTHDFKFLPDDMITTKDAYKDLNICEGSDVFFTGLFSQYIGEEKNYPVVRFGRVALVTDEKINWRGKQMDLYLIEAGSYGGNSGSPVFFYLGIDRIPGVTVLSQPILKLAGVMKGSFLDARKIEVVETKKVPIACSSMGIAAVVPGYKLHEILFSDELKEHRGF